MSSDFSFTVFTPTYNRAKTLYRVYESLCAQTFRDFEWVVVDDGSTDNTRTLVEGWQAQASFPIRYFYQQNKHKKAAYNLGVSKARGQLFLSMDSDDSCKPTAIERLWHHWQTIPETDRNAYSAVTVLCENETGKIFGKRFPADPNGGWIDSDSIEMNYRYRMTGDKWGFQRTDVLRQFPFPQENISGLVPEAVVWERISEHYKTRFVNEVLYTCYAGEDQLTRGHSPEKHALGHAIACKSMLEHGAGYFLYAPLRLLNIAMNFARFNYHVQQQRQTTPLNVEGLLPRLLATGMMPFGYTRFLLDRYRLKYAKR
jgi:glycosyltransferase involved in cell wall biosynthesis